MKIVYQDAKKAPKVYHSKSGDLIRLLIDGEPIDPYYIVLGSTARLTRLFDLTLNEQVEVSVSKLCVTYPHAEIKPGVSK